MASWSDHPDVYEPLHGLDDPPEPYDWNPLKCLVCDEFIEQGRLALGGITCAEHATSRRQPEYDPSQPRARRGGTVNKAAAVVIAALALFGVGSFVYAAVAQAAPPPRKAEPARGADLTKLRNELLRLRAHELRTATPA